MEIKFQREREGNEAEEGESERERYLGGEGKPMDSR
jgi:hypothetical protein